MISILLPTRKRFNYLTASVESLLHTSDNIDNLQILFLFDDDDIDSIEQFNNWQKNFNYKYIITTRLGYSGMHEYNNMLASIADGDWIFLWNDDSRMKSYGWDKIVLEEYRDRFVFISPQNLNNPSYTSHSSMFPIFPKKWYNITGRISPYQQSDTYLNQIAYFFKIFTYEPRIYHEHGDFHTHSENRIQDEVTKEISYKDVVPMNEVQRDIILLAEAGVI